MEQKMLIPVVVVLIIGLGIGAGVGYFAMPPKIEVKTVEKTVTVEVQPLKGKTVKIGNIVASTDGLETEKPFIANITKPDLNDFAKKLGYAVTFDFLIDNADSQAAIHLEKVQSYKATGISLVIGGRWSSQAKAALAYVNENNMLLFSPSSTSPLLSIPKDNLFRMCPDDTVQSPAIAEMLKSWGIKAVIIIQRGDPWADGIYNILETELPKRGITIIDKIRYAAEVTEFSSYLATAEDKAKTAVAKYGKGAVAIEVISFSEIVTIATQAKDYPTIYGLFWFGSDGTALEQRLIDEASVQANKLRIFSTLAAPADSPKYAALYDRFYKLVKQPFGYYTACTYDIAWTLATAVLETQTTDPKTIIPLIPTLTYNQFGASGWTRLNDNGDRYASDYDIWGYGTVAGKVDFVKYGVYSGITGKVSWSTDALAKQGITIPGG